MFITFIICSRSVRDSQFYDLLYHTWISGNYVLPFLGRFEYKLLFYDEMPFTMSKSRQEGVHLEMHVEHA